MGVCGVGGVCRVAGWRVVRTVWREPFCQGEDDTLVALLRGTRTSTRMSPPTPGHVHMLCQHGRLRALRGTKGPRGSVRGSHPDARNLPHHVHLWVGDCEA